MFLSARKAASVISKRPRALLPLLLIDLFFLVSFVGILRVLALKASSFSSSIVHAIFFIIVYVGAALLIYSTAKFFLLRKMSVILEIGSKMYLKKFLALNLILMLMIFIILVVASLISQSVREPYTPYASAFFLGLFLIFSYLFCQAVHSFFVFQGEVVAPIKEGMYLSFRLYPLLLVMALAMVPVIVIFLISGFILARTLFADFSLYTRYYNSYLMVFGVLVTISVYLAIFFNRFYAMELLKKK